MDLEPSEIRAAGKEAQTSCGAKFVMLLGCQGTWNQYGGDVETIRPFNFGDKSFGKAGRKIAQGKDYKLLDD